MRFKQFYIKEKFYTTLSIGFFGDIDVFVNPTRKEINEILKSKFPEIALGNIGKDLYIFSRLLHSSVESKLGKKFDVRLRYLPREPGKVFLSENESEKKATKKVLNLVKRYFPKVKQIRNLDDNKVLVK